VNLTKLELNENQITNLASLPPLVNLISLGLNHNQIADFAPLAPLGNLTDLGLRDNQITDLISLPPLVNLTNLDLSQNQIVDLSPLIPLVNLTNLDLHQNQIVDLTPLISLLNLASLSLGQNQIVDFTPLAHLVNLTGLWVFSNQISDLAPLAHLVKMTNLGLEGKQITDLAPLSSLTNLTTLYLGHNQIADLTPLSSLTNLTNLSLGQNQITDLTPLSPMIKLKELSLINNQITDLTPLSFLTNLTTLYLGKNQIIDPTPLTSLAKLTTLDLNDNKISDFSFLQYFDKLAALDFANNPHWLNIPTDLIAKARVLHSWDDDEKDPTDAQALIRYLVHAQQHYRAIKEAKVILVGDPEVGKTSLIRRLLYDTFDPDSKSTQKIEIHHDDTQFFLDSADSQPLKVHFWDFGGQEIQHSLHKLFLSERCVYVCVVQARTEDKAGESPVEYWLDLIRQYGGDSPVIVVVNKCDIPQHKNFRFSDHKYQEQFPSLQLPSIQTDSQTGTGMAELKNALQTALNSLQHLRFRLPAAHFAVKETLQELNKDYISIEKFDEICEAAGEQHGFAFEENDTRYLADLLHDLGVVVYFKEKDHDLSSKTVLNPAWISEGMYKVITSPITEEKNGVLQKNDLKAILEGKNDPKNGKVYLKPHEQAYILNTLKNFQLAYETGSGHKSTYFIPRQFHPEEPPALKDFWQTKAENCLVFRYQYSKNVPSEIMSRLIVKLNAQIHENLMYREGFVLKDEHTWAYVKVNTFDHYLNISLTRNPETKYLLYWIRKEVQAIHDSFAELSVKPLIIHFHENKEYPINYQELLRYKEKNRPYWISEIDQELNPDTLLGEIEVPKKNLILKLIDDWRIDEAFREIETELERFGGDKPTFSQLRAEFIQGTRDHDYAPRLIAFVNTYLRN
jgi:internalin A